MENGKKIYFASDFHLGVPGRLSSQERERQILRWLEAIRPSAAELFLVGDLFDFWFEYRQAVPRGYVRFLGKLAELRDGGLPITVFTGNHDMWLFDYFEQELGVALQRQPLRREWNNRRFLIGHGDGLGPGDYGYKVLKKVLANPFCQWLFGRLHPNLGIGLAHYFSGKSRQANPPEDHFLGPDQEWLLQYAEAQLQQEDIDFFIFGHRHLPIDFSLRTRPGSRYINLGEWLHYNSYAVFDGTELRLEFFENPAGRVFP